MEIRTRNEKAFYQREMLIDGQLVCWLTLIDFTMRIGSARVRMAGIAGVETKAEHRMKGYMRVLFEDTLSYMEKECYDLSMLFGIPGFYPKFGYASCMAGYKMTMKTRNAEMAKNHAMPLQARPLKPEDLPRIARLANRTQTNRTCSIVRNEDTWTGFRHGSGWWLQAEAQVYETEARDFAGYAAWDRTDQAVNVIEVEATDERYYPTLLSQFAQQAVDKRCENVTLYLPPDHAFVEFAQRFGGECSISFPREADGMMRIVNQATLLTKLRPELERRLECARLDRQAGELVIRTNLGETSLAFGPGEGVQLDMPQDKLIQLVAGYRSARDILSETRVKATTGSEELLNTLFPKGHPYVLMADQF